MMLSVPKSDFHENIKVKYFLMLFFLVIKRNLFMKDLTFIGIAAAIISEIKASL